MTTATFAPIGGSEAAAAVGLDPYKSPVQLWAEKRGYLELAPAGEAARWGTLLQPLIAEQLPEHGYDVMPAPDDESFDGDDLPFMTGHIDGFATVAEDGPLWIGEVGTRGVAEIKTCSLRFSDHWRDDAIPPWYVVQATHYMILTGLRWAVLACLVGGQRLEVRRLDYDEKLADLIVAQEERFWQHVLADDPPSPDGSPATTEVLKRLHPAATGEIVNLTADDAELVRELRARKEARKAAEVAEDEAEQRLKMRLGDAAVGVFEGVPLVRWTNVEQRRLDTAALKEARPEVVEEFTRVSTYRRLWVAK